MPKNSRKRSDFAGTSDGWSYTHQFSQSLSDASTLQNKFKHASLFYSVLLNEYLPSDKESFVMDLPCGEGQMVYILTEMGYKNVLGYDLDEKRLRTGEKLGLPVYKDDVFTVLENAEDDTIDCIFSMDFIEHLEKKDVIRFLNLVLRKMSPDAVLFIRTPCADSPFGVCHIFNDFTHKWAATSGVLERLLCSTGFSRVRIFGEEPRMGMRYGFVRVALHCIAKTLMNVFLKALGHGPPKILTSSMWAVGWKEV